MSILKDFSQRLRSFREHNNFSQEQMAEKLGVTRNYVSMMEGGREPSPPVTKLFNLLDSSPLHSAGESVSTLEARTPREKLKAARLAKGLTVKQLAKAAEVQIGVLQAVEDHGARLPEIVAERVARILPITKEELLEGSETPRMIDEAGVYATMGSKARGPMAADGAHTVPLLSEAACGQLKDVSFLDEGFTDEAVETTVRSPQAFGLKLNGDSMAPEMAHGDKAIVAPHERPKLGRPVIVRTIHGDVLCKYYQTKEGGKVVVLSSVNKAYEPIEIPASEIAWIYPVKQVIKNY